MTENVKDCVTVEVIPLVGEQKFLGWNVVLCDIRTCIFWVFE